MADVAKIIQARGFTLRTWRLEDAESLAANADNRNVWSNLRSRFPRPYTAGNARTWIGRCISGHDRGMQLAIDVDGLAVGGVSVDLVTANTPRTGEIGYWIGEAYWGRGIAGQAVSLTCPLAFEQLALDRIRAVARSSNAASLRILERCGFQVQSRMRRSDRRPGSAVVEMVYARDRDGFASSDALMPAATFA
jgi:RimJ/RimL family protein N-acetyltransferase